MRANDCNFIALAPYLSLLALPILTACSNDSQRIALGTQVYGAHCASCHGAKLEGQPNWQEKLPNGKWPAPPHDDSGHTWQHSDRWLFQVVERGLVPPLAKPGYQTDMPAFGNELSNAEIRAVIQHIKSHWSEGIKSKREELLSRRRSSSQVLIDHFSK